jgi:sugar phosphate isomerase/epimerase
MYKQALFLVISACMVCCTPTSKKMVKTDNPTRMSNQELKISLAQWSFHRALNSKKMDNLDFAAKAKELGFEGIEYVNVFFKDKAQDLEYLKKMNENAKAAQVRQLLIMVDGEGYLADKDVSKRNQAVKNHHKWVDAAAFLGCHSIRVNAHGEGTEMEVAAAAVDGLSKLADYAATKKINVIVENHGGFSSNGKWLSGVMSKINKANIGTLPDFGNFCLRWGKDASGNSICADEYDRYKGVEELMKYAKAVSAKSNNFNDQGVEISTDYLRMLKIVKNAGYQGFLGVEYEGNGLSELEGVKATKKLIEKCLAELKQGS